MLALLTIMPLVSFIVDPNILLKEQNYQFIVKYIDDLKDSQVILIFASASIILLTLSLFTSFYIQHRVRIFIVTCQNRLLQKIVEDCIEAPYTWYLKSKPTKTSYLIQTDVLYWANDGMLRIMHIIGSVSLLFVGTISLIIVSPLIGVFGFLIIILIGYFLINYTRKPITNLSSIRRNSNADSLNAFSLIFKGIKDIKINSKEIFFIENLLKFFKIYGFSGVRLRLIQNISPLIMIILGQGGIILVAVLLWFQGIPSSDIASKMAFIILVISRIMPNANKLINDLNGIWAAKAHIKSLKNLHNQNFKNDKFNQNHLVKINNWKTITFNNVFFRYPDEKNDVIKNITLEIRKGKSYGLVGVSGAGKSTIIDLLTGFLRPNSGNIKLTIIIFKI